MTKAELTAKVCKATGEKKYVCENCVNALFSAIRKELADGGKVQLIGFGTFDVTKRTARTGRNPRTGETMEIPACRVPRFKPGKELKEAVNE